MLKSRTLIEKFPGGNKDFIESYTGAGIAQLVVLGLAATVSRVRYSSGDIFR